LYLTRLIFLTTLFLIIIPACSDQKTATEKPLSSYIPQYSKGFQIHYFADYKVIETENHRYYLTKTPSQIKQKDAVIIPIPVQNMACMAQSHWTAASILNEHEGVSGICDGKYISDTLFQQRFQQGAIKNFAENQTINYEILFSLQPQLLMLSFDNQQANNVLQNLNIPVVLNSDFLENHPLGRAEWLIFVAAFYDKDKEAIAFFNRSVEQYKTLCALIDSEIERPTVFDGAESYGAWYVSGGKSYIAQFYADAGADYVWKDNAEYGSFPVDFEAVYYKGIAADFWRTYLPRAKSYQDIAAENSLYTNFPAWKNRRIFYCDNLRTDLYGMGVYQPEIVLADMLKIFHPELLPEHRAKYYDLLIDN
jgi:iron complex transport system substrate-binding protein